MLSTHDSSSQGGNTLPINCNQANVYQYGESWTTEANEYHTLCAAYRTTSLNTKYQETVYQIAAAPADSHGGDHTAQFVAASQEGGGGGRGVAAVNCQCISVYCSFGARDITLVCS